MTRSEHMEQQQTEHDTKTFDEFVAAPPTSKGELVPTITFAAPTEIHGAQELKVRRDDGAVLGKIRALAAAAGDDWYYRFPVKNRREGTTGYVEGPSVKLTNDVARLYGNCEVDCRVQDLGETFLFHARFIDLETGFALTRPFQQRKSGGQLGKDLQRNNDIALAIGASKATRNVIANALQTFVDYAFEEAKHALVSRIGQDIERWRARAVEKISQRVELARVEKVIGRSAKDWLAPDIAKAIEMMKAVTEGMAALDETFPPLVAVDAEVTTEAELDKFASEKQAGDPTHAEPVAGGSTQVHAPAEPPAPDLKEKREIATQSMMNIARAPGHSLDEKLEQLTNYEPALAEDLPTPFVKQLLATAAKVAKGEIKIDAAMKYVRALPL